MLNLRRRPPALHIQQHDGDVPFVVLYHIQEKLCVVGRPHRAPAGKTPGGEPAILERQRGLRSGTVRVDQQAPLPGD